mmetsp:Transcript_53323/g.116421  ORF Transcript_53323/g.116421 Transcript_53323/m.116421 type:complete len:106 (+) Transcript_53323:208-525(+)
MVNCAIQNRKCVVSLVNTASSLLFRELKEPKRDRKKTKNIKHNGNLTLDQVKAVAKEMRHKSNSKHFTGTVLEIIGTCNSMGCTIDGKTPKEITAEIKSGDLSVE